MRVVSYINTPQSICKRSRGTLAGHDSSSIVPRTLDGGSIADELPVPIRRLAKRAKAPDHNAHQRGRQLLDLRDGVVVQAPLIDEGLRLFQAWEASIGTC